MYLGENKLLLRCNHGLGDCISFQVVLRHLKEFHDVSIEAKEDRLPLYEGLVFKTFVIPENKFSNLFEHHEHRIMPYQRPDEGFPNLPSTKATRCLMQYFPEVRQIHLEHYKYELTIGNPVQAMCDAWIESELPDRPFGLIHSRGVASRIDKDLSDEEEGFLCNLLLEQEITPVLIDARKESPYADNKKVFRSKIWKDVRSLAAMAKRSVFNFGIDSGPEKIWATVDTPSYIFYVGSDGFHPAHVYDDPSKHIVHCVPDWHEEMVWDDGVDYFKENYNFIVWGDNLTDHIRNLEVDLSTYQKPQ
jgi:hypothetical protein